MTDAADLAHDVLLKVADFIRKLPADQLAAVASGEARLDVVPKGARVTGGTRSAAKPVVLARSPDEIHTDLRDIGDRTAARQYLADLKLPELKEVARAFGLPVSGTKQRLGEIIVEFSVGRRLDSEAIGRNA